MTIYTVDIELNRLLSDGTNAHVHKTFEYRDEVCLTEFNRVLNPVGVRIFDGSTESIYPWHEIKEVHVNKIVDDENKI